MRFDDMIATVLERPSSRADQRAAQWRQLVDLLAQRRDGDPALAGGAYAFLRKHRGEIDIRIRERTAAALAGLPVAPELVAFFGEDHQSVFSPLLRGAQLPAAEWTALLPGLSPTGRAILRHRRDLSPAVRQALAAFGASDFVLASDSRVEAAPAPPETEPAQVASDAAELTPAPTGRSQIRDLVERIEAFQRSRTADPVEPGEPVEEFRWETGNEGVILWVDGAPRGPLVGQSIAAIAEAGHHGVDGQAAGAFHKRAPFRDARFSVAGDGVASGDWRISGVPFFDNHRGTFQGYRGTARRPRLDEVAGAPAGGGEEEGLFGTNLPPDSLRQLIHELRTPLNAIIGFAELIEGQYMGPAGARHRGRAGEIVEQARRLLGAVDDLDTAARVETASAQGSGNRVDTVKLLVRLHDAYERQLDERRARIAVQVEHDLPTAALDPAAAERMLSRLVTATTGLAQPDETITALLRLDRQAPRPTLRLEIDRPRAIAGLDELSLLHPGYSPDGDWPEAPALGLGFALRLVRKLAEAAGGALDIGASRFILQLPASTDDEQGAPGAGRNGGESG